MQQYKKNYLKANRVGEQEKIICESCNMAWAVDIHHIIFRSHQGTDEESNLIALCRDCHNLAHSGDIKAEDLQKIANHRIMQRELGNFRGFEYQFKTNKLK
jgi:5-methylcytosine-specific restriction endonuclease McrA